MDDKTDSVAARLDRAQSQTMETHVVSTNPTLVEVDNEDHGTTHAVVPDLLYCSCEDHQYRNTVCKHLLFLMVQDEVEWLSDSVRESLSDRLLELEDQRIDLERELNQVQDKMSEIGTAYESVSNQGKTRGIDEPAHPERTATQESEWDEFTSDDNGVDRMSEELLDGN